MGIRIGDWDWGLGLGIEIGDWDLGLGLRLGIGIIYFDAKDEIHSIYEKLGYSFYHTSSMVVWLLD